MSPKRIRIGALRAAGAVLNLAGLPGFVREGSYRSSNGMTVEVSVNPLFTVICVNGVEVFFYRVSGEIDGVGISASPDCRGAQTPESVPASEIPVGR
jgi:hypothetical protein